MLSDEMQAALAAMPPEDRIQLLVEAAKRTLFKENVGGCMPQSAINDLVAAVGDQQVRDIVHDLRTVSEPGSFLPSKSGGGSGTAVPKERGSGWQKPSELGAPPGIKYIDQALDVQDALDRRDLEKRLK
jgi:hypothetical protein